MAAGRYDACITSVAHFLRAAAVEPGLAARFVCMTVPRTHLAAFVVEGRAATHGRRIADFGDLDGASVIGPPDSGTVKEYRLLLNSLGAAPGASVDVAYQEIRRAWAEGRGDVALEFAEFLPDFTAAARQGGGDARCLPFADAGLDVYGSGLVAGVSLLRDRGDVVRRLVSAVRDSLVATRAEPELGLDMMRARYPALDLVRAVEGWRAGAHLIFDGVPDERMGAMGAGRWRRTIAHHATAHGTPAIRPEDAFEGRFTGEEARTP